LFSNEIGYGHTLVFLKEKALSEFRLGDLHVNPDSLKMRLGNCQSHWIQNCNTEHFC